MGAPPEVLIREIAEARADLGRTIGLIEARVSPRRLRRRAGLALVAGLGGVVTLLVVVRRARHS